MDRRELQREITQEILSELREYEKSALTEKKIGVTHQTMWLWRTGKCLPSSTHMVRLMEILQYYRNRVKST